MPQKRIGLSRARRNAGFTQEELAYRLGVDRSTVGRWETGTTEPSAWLRPKLARILRLAPGTLAGLLDESVALPPRVIGSAKFELEDIDALVAAIGDSQTSQDAIEQLDQAAFALAESHTQAPARQVLTEVLKLHEQARNLLAFHQRLSQRRELYRVESCLLAHACLLFGDLKDNVIAERYGQAALIFARESGASEALARTALAKTLRWARRLIESAEMARLGFQISPQTPVRVQLASQEANAAALLGDARRASEALKRSADAAESVTGDSGASAWSFSTGRQAIFALSVATEAGDPAAALRAAAVADAGWAAGEPMVTANWAQIRVGSGIAHILNGSLDGAVAEVTPVLTLPADRRVSTVTGYMDNLARRLRHPTLNGNKNAAELRRGIIEFNEQALPNIEVTVGR